MKFLNAVMSWKLQLHIFLKSQVVKSEIFFNYNTGPQHEFKNGRNLKKLACNNIYSTKKRFQMKLYLPTLNKVIKREYYQLPHLEEIASRINGNELFPDLDANKGYCLTPLDKESINLITFINTPIGRY